jgi:hypothetical protein
MNQPKACSTCGSVFSSKSHLTRHERSRKSWYPATSDPQAHAMQICRISILRASFVDACFQEREFQYPPVPCTVSSTNSDSARRHAKQCDQRAGRPIPTDVKRGRGPKACDRCALSKLACDTDEPCETCLSRGWRCSYDRVEGVLDVRSKPTNPISSAPQVESWDPREDSATTQDSDDATRSNVTNSEKTLFLLRYTSPDNKNILDFRNALETSSALPDEAGSPPCDLQEDGGQLLSQDDIDMWNLPLIWKILLNRDLEKACTG